MFALTDGSKPSRVFSTFFIVSSSNALVGSVYQLLELLSRYISAIYEIAEGILYRVFNYTPKGCCAP